MRLTIKSEKNNPLKIQGITTGKAIDGTRTRDFHLGKVALYQLSHYRTITGLHLLLNLVLNEYTTTIERMQAFFYFFSNLFSA